MLTAQSFLQIYGRGTYVPYRVGPRHLQTNGAAYLIRLIGEGAIYSPNRSGLCRTCAWRGFSHNKAVACGARLAGEMSEETREAFEGVAR